MSHKLSNLKARRLVFSADRDSAMLLARKAGVSELTISVAENGGTISVEDSARISNATGDNLATLGKVDV